MEFYCGNCKIDFETEKSTKKEFRDYILGPSWKYVSFCPNCGKESDEIITSKPQKYILLDPSGFCGPGGGAGCC